MSATDEALARLDKHEAECAIRYEMIQLQLDNHSKRFDRLEALMSRGFFAMGIMITLAIAILEFAI